MMEPVIWFFVLVLAGKAHGLKCWTCYNARSNEECNLLGYLDTCEPDQVYCQNEVRIIDGLGTQVNKKCKQAQACTNNELQNFAGFSPFQCNSEREQSVCRCCCEKDNCNGPMIGCGRVETCEKLVDPHYGRIVCPAKVKFGTSCIVQCNKGFTAGDENEIKCEGEPNSNRPGQFTPKDKITCEPKPLRCLPIPKTTRRRKVTCTNSKEHSSKRKKNFQGSECTFKCIENYVLFGSPRLSCNRGHWNHPFPICKRGTCATPPGHVQTLVTCTKRYRFGSKCTFRCVPDFKIVGKRVSVCQQSIIDKSRGTWSNGVPQCRRVTCPQIMKPNYGEMVCTNGNFEDSVCTFVCNQGLDIDNTAATSLNSTCLDDGNGVGKWTGPVPTCSHILCMPPLTQPKHGDVICTDANRWGSACKYTCNEGYDLNDTITKMARVTCEVGRDGTTRGQWSDKPPTCSPVKCRPAFKAPRNGYVTCSNHNYGGSICTFRCDEEYDLDITIRKSFDVKCIDMKYGLDRGEWSDIAPTCKQRIRCKEVHKNPENGKVECTDRNYLGGKCRFSCDKGYYLDGKEYTNCVELLEDGNEIAEWTNSPPKCKPKSCAHQWYDFTTVVEECTGLRGSIAMYYLLGTACRYTCRSPGLYAVTEGSKVDKSGSVTARCTNDMVWDVMPPRCLLKVCYYLKPPQNGYEPICSKGNKFKSKCVFSCKYGYRLSHSSPLVCVHSKSNVSKGRWDRKAPICKPIPK